MPPIQLTLTSFAYPRISGLHIHNQLNIKHPASLTHEWAIQSTQPQSTYRQSTHTHTLHRHAHMQAKNWRREVTHLRLTELSLILTRVHNYSINFSTNDMSTTKQNTNLAKTQEIHTQMGVNHWHGCTHSKWRFKAKGFTPRPKAHTSLQIRLNSSITSLSVSHWPIKTIYSG